jgi:hypothetical protein
MAKEKVLFKRKSKGQGKDCYFCGEVAIWEAQAGGATVLCCGSKHCRKKQRSMLSNS